MYSALNKYANLQRTYTSNNISFPGVRVLRLGMVDASPLQVPSPDKGGGLGVRSAASPSKKDPATETNAREPRTSVLRRREGGLAGPQMTRSGESPREAITPKLLRNQDD